MKTKYLKLMAAVMAAISVFTNISANAAWSSEKVSKDYRNMDIMDRNGALLDKPTSQFVAKRVSGGEVIDTVTSYDGYDCAAEFPTLVCYVGDTLTFEDLSRDTNSGGAIKEWDWQYFGAMGTSYEIYNYNIVNSSSFTLTQPGETTFYLCVKSNQKVKNGCCDPWSENGNHQTVGRNKWFPKGAYWYFSAIRVVVKPYREGVVKIRFWDTELNKIFHEGYVNLGPIYNDDEVIETTVHITDWDGYQYLGWNVQELNGNIQYSGTDRDVGVAVAGWVPEKYLNVEYKPMTDRYLEVKYIDTHTGNLIDSEILRQEKASDSSETIIRTSLDIPTGYELENWHVIHPDNTEEKTGDELNVAVELNSDIPHKILEVSCSKPGGGGGGTPTPAPEPTPEPITPSGECDGIITWTETDSHRVVSGYRDGVPQYKNCNHSFTYEANLTIDAEVTPETFKSGYGFEVGVDYDISTRMVSTTGDCSGWGAGRSAESRVTEPTMATIYLPWDMTNRLGSQGRTIHMEKSGGAFRLPESSVSEIQARKIYTPVELPGTQEAPVSHSFEIYVSGGGVSGTEFCQKTEKQITINGVMYDDDITGSD